jgi:hypothetical protein
MCLRPCITLLVLNEKLTIQKNCIYKSLWRSYSGRAINLNWNISKAINFYDKFLGKIAKINLQLKAIIHIYPDNSFYFHNFCSANTRFYREKTKPKVFPQLLRWRLARKLKRHWIIWRFITLLKRIGLHIIN